MEAIGVLLAAGVSALGIVGDSLMRSSEGLKVLVDLEDSNVESVFVNIWTYVYC